MFNDWQQALEAEGLPLNPSTVEQEAAAARVTARNAGGKDDLVLLLKHLGLPRDDATLTTLLPLLPDQTGDPDMPQTPNAFEATALSMHYADASAAEITEATGLSEEEITALVTAQEQEFDKDADPAPAIVTDPAPAVAIVTGDSVEQLLAWAEAHSAAGIRNKAARVHVDLAELTDRRATDDAQREAEERVVRLKAELEKAQEELRAVKGGTRSPTSTATAAAPVPTPIRPGLGSGRTREELAAIRTWARANGYTVANAGIIKKKIIDEYDAAQSATPTRKAS